MITGQTLRDAILSGANNIANQRTRVDELNVFPVPDGDTGRLQGRHEAHRGHDPDRLPSGCREGRRVHRAGRSCHVGRYAASRSGRAGRHPEPAARAEKGRCRGRRRPGHHADL